MRILVIAPEQLPVPPIAGGSVETVIYNVFRRVAKTHKVTIISRAYGRLPRKRKLVNGQLKIIRIPRISREHYIKSAIRYAARRRAYDLIQVENRPLFVPYVRRAFRRTPIVLNLHSLTFMSHLTRKQAKKILAQLDRVFCVSSFITDEMKRRYPDYADKFLTTTIGVDTQRFQPQPAEYKQQLRKKWGVENSFNILFVGRIIPQKGLHTLVKAIGKLKQTHKNIALIAVGSSWPGVRLATPYLRFIRRLAKKLGVKLRFTGYIPPRKIPEMYHLGDVFVCPTRYREGFAMVNPEAMASGIPVIASSRGAITQVIQHGDNGLLVTDYKNPDAFAHAIAQVKESPELGEQLSSNGRKRVAEELSWEHTVASLLEYYHEFFSEVKEAADEMHNSQEPSIMETANVTDAKGGASSDDQQRATDRTRKNNDHRRKKR